MEHYAFLKINNKILFEISKLLINSDYTIINEYEYKKLIEILKTRNTNLYNKFNLKM